MKFKEENLPIRVKLRRWWKLKKDEMRWKGWRAFQPRWTDDIYYWVKDHLFPYNVIKIKTLTCRYTDKDQILLHGAFQVLVDFVEQEWIPSKYHGKLIDLEQEEKNYRSEGYNDEFIKSSLEGSQIHNDDIHEVWNLYIWWKYFRPNRDAQNPLWHAESPSLDLSKVVEVDEDGDPTFYEWHCGFEDPVKDAQWHQACLDSHEFEKQESQEDEEMFIRLVKMRQRLWT